MDTLNRREYHIVEGEKIRKNVITPLIPQADDISRH
jgi:hypothetical protein